MKNEKLAIQIAGEISLADNPGVSIRKWRDIFNTSQKELSRVLKPGGKLVIIDEWSPLFSGENLVTADNEVKNLLSQLELLFRFTFHPITGKGEMRKLIEDAGFDYSKKRASEIIDGKHNMYGHVYFKKAA